jgi:hypothetical protein
MSPDEKFVTNREAVLSDLESDLARNLTDSGRVKVAYLQNVFRQIFIPGPML